MTLKISLQLDSILCQSLVDSLGVELHISVMSKMVEISRWLSLGLTDSF